MIAEKAPGNEASPRDPRAQCAAATGVGTRRRRVPGADSAEPRRRGPRESARDMYQIILIMENGGNVTPQPGVTRAAGPGHNALVMRSHRTIMAAQWGPPRAKGVTLMGVPLRFSPVLLPIPRARGIAFMRDSLMALCIL